MNGLGADETWSGSTADRISQIQFINTASFVNGAYCIVIHGCVFFQHDLCLRHDSV